MRRISGVLAGVAVALGWMVGPGIAAAKVVPVVRFHSVQYDRAD